MLDGVDKISVLDRASLRLLAVVLLLAVSALAVVHSSYQARQVFSALQQEHRETVRLEEEWGRLLLEQSTWASHARVEHLARTKLQMTPPEGRNIHVVVQ